MVTELHTTCQGPKCHNCQNNGHTLNSATLQYVYNVQNDHDWSNCTSQKARKYSNRYDLCSNDEAVYEESTSYEDRNSNTRGRSSNTNENDNTNQIRPLTKSKGRGRGERGRGTKAAEITSG